MVQVLPLEDLVPTALHMPSMQGAQCNMFLMCTLHPRCGSGCWYSWVYVPQHRSSAPCGNM